MTPAPHAQEEQLDGREVPIKFVSFQSVNSLTFFVESNQGNEDETLIMNLGIYGQAVQGTNMSELKGC
jgi:hypothetical protein